MKTINALAYIRQLCCSKLPRDIVLLELLSAVQTVIPSCNNFFVGYDAELFPIYTVQDYSFGKLTEYVPELILPYYSDANRSRWQKLFKSQAKIEITIMVDNFYKSDIYNAFYRPFEQHHIIGAPAYHNGQVVGALELCRPRHQKPFSDSDHALLLRIMPYVSHAMQLPIEAESQYYPNGNTGMMIMDHLGTLLFQDETAKHLITLANSGVFPFPSGPREFDIMPQLGKMCRNLNAIFQGKEAFPPCLSHHNGYGKFIFQAHWLDSVNNEQTGLIVMSIDHHEPQTLKILRSMQKLPLSPSQKEVVMLLAQGKSNDYISNQLHIGKTTVKDHIRKIFVKLDIHSRDELLPILLALDKQDVS